MRFVLVRGVLPLTGVGLVSIVLFWLATPAASANSMLDLWTIAPWFAALGVTISSIGWLSNERLYRANTDQPARTEAR